MPRHCFFVFLSSIVLLLPRAASAGDRTFDRLTIHSFLSQGYINSSGNNFLSPDSREGTFQINEVGLTVSSQVNDDLRVGAQLLSRDLGTTGNNSVRLDWGYGDYRLSDLLGFRMGKVKRPMGLYNEIRDSDFLSPLALLPQSIYDEARRDMLVAYQGLGLYGTVPLRRFGTIDYHLFSGEFNFTDDSVFVASVKQQAAQVAASQGLPPVTSVVLENDSTNGAAFILNTADDRLRIGASYQQARQWIYVNGSSVPQGELRVYLRPTYSLEFTWERLQIVTEFGFSKRRQTIFDTITADGRTVERYVMVGYGITDSLTATALYDEFYGNANDLHGRAYTTQGKPAYLAWRKDFGLCLRYDVNQNMTVKAEWHAVDGAALYLPVYNPSGVQQDWNYVIIKASFNF